MFKGSCTVKLWLCRDHSFSRLRLGQEAEQGARRLATGTPQLSRVGSRWESKRRMSAESPESQASSERKTVKTRTGNTEMQMIVFLRLSIQFGTYIIFQSLSIK